MNLDLRGGGVSGFRSDPEAGKSGPPSLLLQPHGQREAGTAPGARARNMPVEAAIVRRFLREEGSLEEVLLEIYQSGISMHRAEAVARTLWGGRVNAATLSELRQRIATRITLWRNRPIPGRHVYVYLGAVVLRRRWGGETQHVRVLTAVGVNEEGSRRVLGVVDGTERNGGAWGGFLRDLRVRGLAGVRLFISEGSPEIAVAAAEVFPAAAHQACLWQLQRDLLGQVAIASLPKAAALFDAILESGNRETALERARLAAGQLRKLHLAAAAHRLEEALDVMVSHYAFPREHWKSLRSNYALMKILRKVRERTRLVGAFSDSESAVLIVSARLRCVADQWAASRHRLAMAGLDGKDGESDRDLAVPPRAGDAWRHGTGRAHLLKSATAVARRGRAVRNAKPDAE
jgi:putative transposase